MSSEFYVMCVHDLVYVDRPDSNVNFSRPESLTLAAKIHDYTITFFENNFEPSQEMEGPTFKYKVPPLPF
jgi:hypothetical protein